MAMTVATVVGGRLVGGFSWVDGALGAVKIVGSMSISPTSCLIFRALTSVDNNIRKFVIPSVIVTSGTY